MNVVNFYIQREFACNERKFKKLVGAICRRFDITNATVSVAVVGNIKIRALNKKFLRRKTNTDCLSFDLSDRNDKRKLFDLVVNAQRAKSEAKKRQHSSDSELALYITHGLLHLLGYDDHRPEDAKKMHRLEDEILRQHRFGAVYEKSPKGAREKC